MHLGSLEAMSIKVFCSKVVDFAGGVVFHRGGSVTNMATLSSYKITSCEKKKNIMFLEYICSPISLRWETSMEWADSLCVDFFCATKFA